MFGIASRYVEAKSKFSDLQDMQSGNFASNPTMTIVFAEQKLPMTQTLLRIEM
jgi:hypothetical protein